MINFWNFSKNSGGLKNTESCISQREVLKYGACQLMATLNS